MDERRQTLRRQEDRDVYAMSELAYQNSKDALKEIRAHVAECANNYRNLTKWIIATLLSVVGGLALFLLNFAFEHLFK